MEIYICCRDFFVLQKFDFIKIFVDGGSPLNICIIIKKFDNRLYDLVIY